MASPTIAQINTMFKNATRILEQEKKFSSEHTAAGSAINVGANYNAMEDTLSQSLITNFPDGAGEAIRSFRSTKNSVITQAALFLNWIIREYGFLINAPETDIARIHQRVYQHFIDNSLSVNSRNFTFGAPAASGSIIGNGAIKRLTKDENDLDMEAVHTDTKIAEVISDEHSGGIAHEEVFQFRGENAERDALKIDGSGRTTTIKAMSARDSQSYIQNPSFSDFNGSITTLTGLPGWTVGSALSNFALVEGAANNYRGSFGDSTPRALKITGNDFIEQNLDVLNARFDPKVPYYFQIAYNREVGSGDGVLHIHIGSQVLTVTLSAQTGWNLLILGPGDENWYKNWKLEDPKVRIRMSLNTTGYTLVDDIVFAPFRPFDGSFYAAVGGSTPFQNDDKITWSDTATQAIIQEWLWKAYGVYWPHNNAGGETLADPAD